MSTLTIRSCDEELSRCIHTESEKRGISINKLILELLENAFAGGKRKRYTDLDHLAGTWTPEDSLLFDKATADIRQVNEDEWK